MSIDTVDLAAGPEQTAAEIDRALREVGFLQVVGHGVPPTLRSEVLDATTSFFDAPDDEKRRTIPPPRLTNRGYSPMASERLGTTRHEADDRGVSAVTAPDLFESFTIGPPEIPDDAVHRAGRGTWYFENVWPPDTALRTLWTAWWHQMERLGALLLEHFAAALSLPPGWFTPFFTHDISALRAINYPALDRTPDDGSHRVGPHTDYGSCTVLLAEDVPGLEVHRGREWVPIDPVDDGFVVNLGDLMMEWTNDRWVSTLHRVRPVEVDGTVPRRRSIAFFQQPNPDAVIACLPTCVGPGRPPRRAAITSGDHFLSKLNRQAVTTSATGTP